MFTVWRVTVKSNWHLPESGMFAVGHHSVWVPFWRRNGSDVTVVRFQRKSAMTSVDHIVMLWKQHLCLLSILQTIVTHPWLISWNVSLFQNTLTDLSVMYTSRRSILKIWIIQVKPSSESKCQFLALNSRKLEFIKSDILKRLLTATLHRIPLCQSQTPVACSKQ